MREWFRQISALSRRSDYRYIPESKKRYFCLLNIGDTDYYCNISVSNLQGRISPKQIILYRIRWVAYMILPNIKVALRLFQSKVTLSCQIY